MKLKFKFWNDWNCGLTSIYDGHVHFFDIYWTRDIDFWGFKVVIFNFSFSWYWKKQEK